MFWLKLNILYHYKYLKLIYNIYFLERQISRTEKGCWRFAAYYE